MHIDKRNRNTDNKNLSVCIVFLFFFNVSQALHNLRRGDTKGSCVRRYNSDRRCDVTPAWVVHEPWTGMKLDIHS